MLVWVVTVGEPLAIDGGKARLFRSGLLARTLVDRGHHVMHWTSTFDHSRKRQRFGSDTVVEVSEGYRLTLLHGAGYRQNVSLRRIVDHQILALKFAAKSRLQPRPDVVICSLPTLELAAAVVQYARRNRVPSVVDVRDLWPDIFLEIFPGWTRGAARLALEPMFSLARYACSHATAIVAMCPQFVEWGVALADRPRTALDRCFPLGYSEQRPAAPELREAERFWQERGLKGSQQEFTACFFGSMERQFELETVISAGRRLAQAGRNFRFVLCGTGGAEAHYRKLAEGCDNVMMPGWVGAPEIWTLMRMSSVGLAPYRSSPSFMMSIPNKAIEYLSAGLPVVSSLRGSLEQTIEQESCGITYANGDPDALAGAMMRLQDSPDRMQRLSANAYDLYRKRFVAEKVYGEMAEYLEQIALKGVADA